ncbi:MAG: hypothetical protein AB1752_02245 [Candidatus Zixiibacteriota bacterium]
MAHSAPISYRCFRPVIGALTTILLVSLVGDSGHAEPSPQPDSVLVDSLSAGMDAGNSSIGNQQTVSQPQLDRLPVRGAAGITRLQPGVTYDARAGALHIHGGLPEDALYLVDGIPQQDPSTGQPIGMGAHTGLDAVTLETGTWSAAQGGVTSGMIQATSAPTGSLLHGDVEGITDDRQDDALGYKFYGLSLSGPLVPGSDHLTFAGFFERNWTGDPARSGGARADEIGNRYDARNWRGKIQWRPTGLIGIDAGVIGSEYGGREYLHAYYFNAAHMPRLTQEALTWWGELSHRLAPNWSYSVRAHSQSTEFKKGDGVYFDDVLGYARPNQNPQLDGTYLFWRWDDDRLDPDSLAAGSYVQLVTPVVTGTDTLTFLDGSMREVTYIAGGDEGHVYEDYFRRKTTSNGVKFDMTGWLGGRQEIRFGAEYQRFTYRRYNSIIPNRILDQDTPWLPDLGFRYVEQIGYDELAEGETNTGHRGARRPIEFGTWLQSGLALSDLRVLAGVRLDHFDYGTQWVPSPYVGSYQSVRDLDTLLEDSPTHTVWSPRLGVHLNAGKRTAVHLSHGIYHRQQPWDLVQTDYRYFYMANEGVSGIIHSNPGMKPVSTKRTEAGVSYQFAGPGVSLSAEAFHAKSSNLPAPRFYPWFYSEYSMFSDEMVTTAEGINIRVDVPRIDGLAASLRYTFTDVKSRFRPYVYPYPIVWQNQEGPRPEEYPSNYDQPSIFTAIVDLRSVAGQGPSIGKIRPLENTGANLVFTAASGYPYTPLETYNEAAIVTGVPNPRAPLYSSRTPSTYQLDLKVDREFNLKGSTLNFYLWVVNLFDRENVIDVWQSSGLPNTTGWLSTGDGQVFTEVHSMPTDASFLTGEEKYRFRENDPTHYGPGRQIRFGAKLSF